MIGQVNINLDSSYSMFGCKSTTPVNNSVTFTTHKHIWSLPPVMLSNHELHQSSVFVYSSNFLPVVLYCLSLGSVCLTAVDVKTLKAESHYHK